FVSFARNRHDGRCFFCKALSIMTLFIGHVRKDYRKTASAESVNEPRNVGNRPPAIVSATGRIFTLDGFQNRQARMPYRTVLNGNDQQGRTNLAFERPAESRFPVYLQLLRGNHVLPRRGCT